MKKTFIALALATLGTMAHAQSSVVVYGVADMDYTYLNHSLNSGSKSLSSFNSGGLSGSRLGFKGTEDLGNGLSVNFVVEGGLQLDTGDSAQDGLAWGRQSTVGLKSNTYGEVLLGRKSTLHDDLNAALSVVENGTVARNNAVYQVQSRYDNAAFYYSPVWNGLQLKGVFSTQSSGSEVEPFANNTAFQSSDTNNRVWGLGVDYRRGDLFVGATYEYNKAQDVQNSNPAVDGYDSGDVWNVGAAYDFKVVRVSGQYGVINYARNTQLVDPETRDQRKQWSLGISAPITSQDRVGLQYSHADTSMIASGPDYTSSMWGVSYFHDLSKRTTLYAAYADINNDSDIQSVITDSSNVYGGYQSAFQVGLRHSF